MLARGLDRNLPVIDAVNDERGNGHVAKHLAKRPLIRIEEISCVWDTEHRVVERAHVRDTFAREPYRRELHGMDRMVDVVIPSQLHLLNAYRGQHRQ